MITFGILSIFVLLALGSYFLTTKTAKQRFDVSSSFDNSMIAWSIITLIYSIVIIIVICIQASGMYDDMQKYRVINQKIEIYKQQKQIIQQKYEVLLDTSYKNYELKIFDKVCTAVKRNEKIVPANVDVNILPTEELLL